MAGINHILAGESCKSIYPVHMLQCKLASRCRLVFGDAALFVKSALKNFGSTRTSFAFHGRSKVGTHGEPSRFCKLKGGKTC